MRRSFAILLALVLSLGLVLPAFAQSASSVLPACCRRNGAHHCSMGAPEAPVAGAVTTVQGTGCPLFPHALQVANTPPVAIAGPVATAQQPQRDTDSLPCNDRDYSARMLLHEPGRGPPGRLSA